MITYEGLHTTGAGYWQEGAGTLRAREQESHEHLVAHALRGEGFDASEDGTGRGTGRGTPIVPVMQDAGCGATDYESGKFEEVNHARPLTTSPDRSRAAPILVEQAVCFAENSRAELRLCGGDGAVSSQLTTGGGKPGQGQPCIAFEPRYYTRDNKTGGAPSDVAVLKADAAKAGDSAPHVCTPYAVRRLTPKECERLQGFPDGYTAIDWSGWRAMDESETPEGCREAGLEVKQTKKGWRVKDADGPRYKALGNSMATNVMQWIGRRIAIVETL